jgi:trehalose 6-phosphate synthase
MNDQDVVEKQELVTRQRYCDDTISKLLGTRTLIIASNRGPVTFTRSEAGELVAQRGGGGLVTALIGLAQKVDTCWIASAMTNEDRVWHQGEMPLEDGSEVSIHFIPIEEQEYDGYYNVISNPLLWFLQHSMWDFVRSPTINSATWKAWDEGYMRVNQLFAQAISQEVRESDQRALVILQDYHLYLAPRMIRGNLTERNDFTLAHFIHIPWPGSEDWGMVPFRMRQAILDGLTALDLLGFQTREDSLNFIRTCESYLPAAEVSFQGGWVRYRGHTTFVRDFPISIDVDAIHQLAESDEVVEYHRRLVNRLDDYTLILRVDRTEPSKNIVRGFLALDELLDLHPEHLGKVQFWSYLVPSRLEVEEYQDYLDEIMAAAGRVNARYGDGEWEPVRVVVGENYPRAVAAMKRYDILLVNSIADGMNLVAKEGPTVNERDGVVILSERTGARQQLEAGALVISPCDVHDTAKALHRALTMPLAERRERAELLRQIVEREDIADWLCRQFEVIQELGL